MRKTSILLLVLFMCLVSCKQKKVVPAPSETVFSTLTPKEVDISGDMSGCFKVIDREYEITEDDFSNGIITIELERTGKNLPFDLKGRELCSFSETLFAANVQVGFGIEFIDGSGNVVEKTSACGSGLSGSYDREEPVALCKLKEGDKGTIRFSVSEKAADAVSFRISSSYKENKESKSAEDSKSENFSDDEEDVSMSDEISDSSNKGSEDWDALLTSYEKYVDKYISLMKKAANGDMDAMGEYPVLMEKAEELGEKMQNAEGSMSAAQWARYNRINTKMMKAAQR